MDKEKAERAKYALAGVGNYYLGREPKPNIEPENPLSPNRLPRFVFTFWYAPEYKKSKGLMHELKARFSNSGVRTGVGLFVRPMGDVLPNQYYDYDPEMLQGFLQAAADTQTNVFINVSGMQWTDVAYKKSPLLEHLESRGENLMKYQDGARVERKLQPPADSIPERAAFLRGLLKMDNNGVLYLNPNAEEVRTARKKNLAQMARVVRPFARDYSNLFLGISTENEVDYPGNWITGDKELTMDEYMREQSVRSVLERQVKTFQDAGVEPIYTNQSIADARRRGSPLKSADIPGANVGITAWGMDNVDLYYETALMAHQERKRWALVISNPLSLKRGENITGLRSAAKYNPDFIGVYNWWPHFWGYGVKNMALEAAIKGLPAVT